MVLNQKDIHTKQTVEFLIERRYGISPEDLNGKRRSESLIKARFMAYWLYRFKFGMALKTIGTICERDHTTIMNGIERVVSLGMVEEAKALAQMELSTVEAVSNSNNNSSLQDT